MSVFRELEQGEAVEATDFIILKKGNDLIRGRTVQDIINLAIPVGDIVINTTGILETGFLECDGAAVSRIAFSSLFNKIGETWGAGDGVNTFNVPDLRAEILRGWDHGRGVDSGRGFATYQGQQLPNHYHSVPGSGASGGGTSEQNSTGSWDGGAHVRKTTGSIVYGLTGEVRMRNAAVMFCIKY